MEDIYKNEKETKDVAVVEPKKEIAEHKLSNVNEQSEFNKNVDIAKSKLLEHNLINDSKFTESLSEQVKITTTRLIEVETEKAELEKQNVIHHQELLETQQKLNEFENAENEWANKEKKRLFHYNGVKPIMLFVGITEPMNLVILYVLTAFLLPFYLLNKFWAGTFGSVISGAKDEDRAKTAKGFLWTALCTVILIVILIVSFIVLRYLNMLPNV